MPSSVLRYSSFFFSFPTKRSSSPSASISIALSANVAEGFSLEFFEEPVPVSSFSEIRYDFLLKASPANVNVPSASAMYKLFASGTPATPFPVTMSFLPSPFTSTIAIAWVVRMMARRSIKISSCCGTVEPVAEKCEVLSKCEVRSAKCESSSSFAFRISHFAFCSSLPISHSLSSTVRRISPTNLNVPSPSLK